MAVSAAVERLGLAALDRVPERYRPAVRPDRLTPGILHLGLGAFHRAHQAVYTEDAIVAAGGDWGIVGVAPRSKDVLERLLAQDNLYSVVTLSPADTRPRVVGVLAELRHAASDPMAVVRRIADPRIRVVTLTVTEKAYGLDPATRRLREDPELRADLCSDRPPRTLPGLLVRGLMARAAGAGAPLAVLSCDNLPANGRTLGGMVHQALALLGPHPAADWLDGHVTFPNSMVDRIVPATTAQTLDRARQGLGVADLAAVAAEPFSQWVIEDEFPAGRPAWERAGAIVTDDVRPWERMKLRVLNGVHSTLAYLGALAGAETIDAALELPGMTGYLTRLIDDDIAPTLSPPAGERPERYGRTVLERFTNPALGHRTLQVAMDGSQKLPQRLLGTIVDRRRAGAVPRWATLSLAGWMRFVRGYADDGTALPLDDPLAEALRRAVADAPDTPDGLAGALLARADVVPAELADDDLVRRLVAEWLEVLDRHGVAGALERAGGDR